MANVCILDESEFTALTKFGLTPNCGMHRHAKKTEANAWTSGDSPAAEWVGNRQI